MKRSKPKYETEPELHELFDRLLAHIDAKPEADLAPNIDGVDAFLALYFAHESPGWLHLYELPAWDLIKVMFSGTERAFGLEPLPQEYSQLELAKLVDRLSIAVSNKNSVRQELIDDSIKLKAIPMILASRCLAVAHVCMLQFKVPIQLLIQQARQGDSDAFLDLVKLDNSFLYTQYGRRMLLEAELHHDREFKAGLADALEPDPKLWSQKGKRKHLIFLTLWMLGDYAQRSDRDWAEFLAAHSLSGFEQYHDVNNVRMQRMRYNLGRPDST